MLEKDPSGHRYFMQPRKVRSLDGTLMALISGHPHLRPASIDAKRMDYCICSISATVQLKKIILYSTISYHSDPTGDVELGVAKQGRAQLRSRPDSSGSIYCILGNDGKFIKVVRDSDSEGRYRTAL